MNVVASNISHLQNGLSLFEGLSIDELRNIAETHPYFGFAQFMLAKKMEAEGKGNFEKQIQIAALHFPNPSWFYYQWSKKEFSIEEMITTPAAEDAVVEDIQPKDAVFVVDESITEPESGENGINDERDELASVEISEKNIPPFNEEPRASDIVREDKEPIDSLSIEALEDILPEKLTIVIENVGEPATENLLDEDFPTETIIAEPGFDEEREETMEADSKGLPADIIPEETSVATEKTEQQKEEVSVSETADDKPLSEEKEASFVAETERKLGDILQEQIAVFKKPVTDEDILPVATEPYHTIDYFASQGIKLLLLEDPQDNLGSKMRRFTDWLKQMKRINPNPTDLGVEEAREHLIQNIAEISNEPEEVITEAMADVLAKQGKSDKAIQVYIKLGFLNPSKSAYFAAKIKNIKDI